MSAIAFFDFDGTITKGDSFFRFLFFKRKLNAELLYKLAKALWVMAAWKLGFQNNNKSKEKIFSIFFKGTDEGSYTRQCSEFASTVLPGMIKKDAMEKIQWHLNEQHKVVIVSASVESYIAFFATGIKADYIATRIEVENGKLSGNFLGHNCYGAEKATRILAQYNIRDYDLVYAYGDTNGDKEMLNLADKPFFRYFHG